MTKTLEPFTPEDLSMQYDAGNYFPFAENEHCNITGYGHQDKAEFAAKVCEYDQLASGEGYTEDGDDPVWSADDVAHAWAVRTSEELCHVEVDGSPVGPDTPGAFPITTLWGQR